MRGKRIIIWICAVLLCFTVTGLENVPAYAATGSAVESAYQRRSDQLEEDIIKYHIPGMAILVVDSDEVVFSKTYGNCESIDTPFIIGSMSKSFTALAVMQLVEAGKIDLEKPISAYIDTSIYLKKASDGDRITVRQLLNHTSGLGTYQRFGNAEITDSYGKHQYANVNYGLLGKIIEAVSGVSYADYLEENIFVPLQMNHTAATLEKSKEDGLIAGYRNYFGIPIAGAPDYPDAGSWSTVPAGYISSSASDMGKYLQMYLNGGEGIISQDSLDTMFYDNVKSDDSGLNFYGMGWELSKQFGTPRLQHAGLVENYASNMFIFPLRETGIVILVNMNDYLVGNDLLGNCTVPFLGGGRKEVSGNPYLEKHLQLDLIYLLILILALYPLVSIKHWRKKKHTKGLLVFDIVRHGIFPIILVAIPNLIGIPMWVVWYYVKDLCIVLIASASILAAVGIYKIIYLKEFRKG